MSQFDFKKYVYEQIIKNVDGDIDSDQCTDWKGYKKNCKTYSKATHIVYMKNGRRHFIDPQTYIYKYHKYPEKGYTELLNDSQRVRNIDTCKKRGICCCFSHFEEY